MSKRSLWYYLSVPTLLSVLTIAFASKYSVIKPHIEFYIITIFSFILLSALGLIAGFRTTAHRNKNLFSSIALALTLGKIIIAVILAVVYIELYPEISNWFILPFFLIYLYFTIYETFAMVQIGRHPYS
jgi:hypothetical protein